MSERIKVENLSFSYGETDVPGTFESLSFSLSSGELMCLPESNSTGKSTLLKCMSDCLRLPVERFCLDGKTRSSIVRILPEKPDSSHSPG